MIIKLISPFLVAASALQLLPTDLAYLEYAAGVGSEAYAQRIPVESLESPTLGLPIADARVNYPVKIDMDSHGIVTTAQSAIVVDAATGMILLAKHPDQVRSIASVTKLMTALVFLEQNPDLSQTVSLDEDDLVEGGRIYLNFYTDMRLEDVLAASLVGSDNTATKSLVRFSGLAPEAFITRMNEKAEELGMENTVFVDPTGIDGRNMSTARDLVALLAASEAVPEIKTLSTTPELTIQQSNGHTVQIENTNGLLTSYLNHGEYTVEGGKTGYLPQAGYVLASTVAEGEKRVHVVVMGSESIDSRVQEVKGLAAWAFRVFAWPGEQTN